MAARDIYLFVDTVFTDNTATIKLGAGGADLCVYGGADRPRAASR